MVITLKFEICVTKTYRTWTKTKKWRGRGEHVAFSKKTSYPIFPTKHTLAMLMYLFVYEVAGSDQPNNVGKITTTVNSVSQKKTRG